MRAAYSRACRRARRRVGGIWANEPDQASESRHGAGVTVSRAARGPRVRACARGAAALLSAACRLRHDTEPESRFPARRAARECARVRVRLLAAACRILTGCDSASGPGRLRACSESSHESDHDVKRRVRSESSDPSRSVRVRCPVYNLDLGAGPSRARRSSPEFITRRAEPRAGFIWPIGATRGFMTWPAEPAHHCPAERPAGASHCARRRRARRVSGRVLGASGSARAGATPVGRCSAGPFKLEFAR